MPIFESLSRLFPDPETQEGKDELKKIFQAVSINNPDVLREMEPSFVQKKRMRKSGLPGHALNVRGPLVNRAVHQFGRKLTMAAHYDVTGNIIPRGAGVAVRRFTYYQAMTEGLPPELSKHLGPPRTLKQGKWGVEDQFFIQWMIADTGTAAGYFAAFRKSFAILGAVDMDRAFLETFDNGVVFDVFEPPECSAQTSSNI